VGCVEITGSGCEFANPSGPFSKSFLNINNVLLQAINNGINPQNNQRVGLQTGYLYEMARFEQVQDAFKAQLEYFSDWWFTLNNIMEYVGNKEIPVPIASATMDGCMENGRDLMMGGAKYNATGGATLGVGTLADSLASIKYMVYDKKLCTARELYDAIMANWKAMNSFVNASSMRFLTTETAILTLTTWRPGQSTFSVGGSTPTSAHAGGTEPESTRPAPT
jgi:formate C-acetyltransferase